MINNTNKGGSKMRKTRTSQIEAAIADIFTIVDGHNGIDSDTIMEKMMDKGHDGIVVNDTINIMEETGAIAWVAGQWYIASKKETKTESPVKVESKVESNKTKTTQKESTMKTENLTIEQIIENLESNKKEETLKKAKADAQDIGIPVESGFRTKKDFLEYLTKLSFSGEYEAEIDNKQEKENPIVVSAGIDANEVKEYTYLCEKCGKKIVSNFEVDQEEYPILCTYCEDNPEKTEYQQKQDNILISMVSVRDGIQTAIKALENNTLKQVKSDVYALLNTEARKNLSSDFITIITEANNTRVKKDYASELRIALKELNALIENEADIQEKETSVIPIDKKVKALTPDTAMLISQLDLKEKSRFDTLFNLITEQDKKIKELSKLVSCHKDTINLLINRLQTVDGTNVSPNKKTDVKPAEKPVKTPEELQIEERQAYIVGLKGIDKVVFDILTTQKRLNEAGFLIMEALEDYTPKMIKASLAAMISNGLFDCTKNTYTIAPASSFKGNKGNKVEKPINKPAKAKKTFIRGKASGKFTRKQAIQQAIEETMKSEKSFTMKDILLRQDDIFVKAGGNSNPKATNATTAALKALLAEGSLAKDGKEYIVK
jgi:DNA-directed RNA polymerase subunit RPC12/RpoP